MYIRENITLIFKYSLKKIPKSYLLRYKKSVINLKQKLYYLLTDHTAINLEISYEHFKVPR